LRLSGVLGWVLLALTLVAAVLLVVADFSTISHRTIGIGACSDRVDPGVCRTTGHESHAFALVILAPVALVMGWGAVVGRSRAAAVALVAIGVAVLLIALAIDLPKLDDKRNLNIRYNDVAAHTDSAFKVELTGGVLLLLAGGLALTRAGSPEAGAGGARRLRRDSSAAGEGEPPEGARERRMRERAQRRKQSSASPAGEFAEAGAGGATEPQAVEPAAVEPAAVEPEAPEPVTEPAAPDPGGELSPDAYRKPSGEPDPPEAPPAG
jgi:hypothetical protein